MNRGEPKRTGTKGGRAMKWQSIFFTIPLSPKAKRDPTGREFVRFCEIDQRVTLV